MSSQQINPKSGSWTLYHGNGELDQANELPEVKSPSCLNIDKASIVTGIVFLALGAMAAGGLVLYFKVNTIAAWSLLGGGGTLLISDLIAAVVLSCQSEEAANISHVPQELPTSQERPWPLSENDHHESNNTQNNSRTYRIVSWNVGTLADYSNMFFINTQLKAGTALGSAYQKTNDNPYFVNPEEKKGRQLIFKNAFEQFGNPDIICLQETWQMSKDYLQAILPPGYSHFSYENRDGKNCTVVWKSEKLSQVDHAKLLHDPEYIPHRNSAPDTIVLLKDTATGTTICVDSAHLRGFSLAYDTFDETLKKQELKTAETGDNQTRYDLDTMDAVPADFYVIAGDFNATLEHYKPRFKIIEDHGYFTDLTDKSPTIYDGNLREEDGLTPKPARLDHIFVKGQTNLQVKMQYVPLKRTELNDFTRPSDHLPIGADVTLNFRAQHL